MPAGSVPLSQQPASWERQSTSRTHQFPSVPSAQKPQMRIIQLGVECDPAVNKYRVLVISALGPRPLACPFPLAF